MSIRHLLVTCLYVWCLQRNQQEAIIATKTGVSDISGLHVGLGIKPGSSARDDSLLTTDPSFYPLFLAF